MNRTITLNMNKKRTLGQLIKYAIVGCINTILTLGVIFVCKSLLGVNEYVSNGIGYVVGIINSFLWNRSWVFNSRDGHMRSQAVRFLAGFFICYAIQLLIVWLINKSWFGETQYNILGFVLSGYGVATLIGNVAYTLCNFIYNKIFTFKK